MTRRVVILTEPGALLPMNIRKRDFPTEKARQYLEPGPIVLLSSHRHGHNNIMTLGWHTMLEFSPSLPSCVIAAGNHSFSLVRNSGECVINLPTTDLTDKVVAIGNTSGASVDKFRENGLTPVKATKVSAPLIAKCHANFECCLYYDDQLMDRYNFFIFEIVKAHVATRPRHPQTLHYTGEGVFIVARDIISWRGQFKPEML